MYEACFGAWFSTTFHDKHAASTPNTAAPIDPKAILIDYPAEH